MCIDTFGARLTRIVLIFSFNRGSGNFCWMNFIFPEYVHKYNKNLNNNYLPRWANILCITDDIFSLSLWWRDINSSWNYDLFRWKSSFTKSAECLQYGIGFRVLHCLSVAVSFSRFFSLSLKILLSWIHYICHSEY